MRSNSFHSYLPSIVSLFLFISCSNLSRHTQEERREIALTYYQKGQQNKAKHNDVNALRFFRKAIEADSLCVDAYVGLGELLILRREYSEAEKVLTKVPAAAMSDGRICYLAGSSQFHQKKINDAVQNLEKTLLIKPDHREASWMLARLYCELENYEHATQYLEKLLLDSLFVDHEKIVMLNMKVVDILNKRSPKSSFEKKVFHAIAQSNTVTRGQFAFVIVVSIPEDKAPDSNLHFADVALEDSILVYYQKAVTSGILENLPDHKFYPEYVITRRNFAYYLNRILQSKNIGEPQPEQKIVLADIANDDFQFSAIRAVCSRQLMSTKKDGNFNPQEPITGKELIESVAMLKKMLKKR